MASGIAGAQARITSAVLDWEGTAVQPHRFGGVEYVLGTREIGHIHGDYLVDIPFPTKVRDQVVAAGRAEPHHLLAESGWISFYIRAEADVAGAIALLQESYALAARQKGSYRQ
jgi:predicted DNA-binding protein (MmcQ/YjbR family)